MNAEQLEAWINDKACPLYFHDKENDEGYDGRAIMVSEIEKLFAGKVLVPVERINKAQRHAERVRELEEWIEDKGEQFEQTMGGFSEALKLSRHCKYPSPQYVSVDAIEELFDGKVLVPVEIGQDAKGVCMREEFEKAFPVPENVYWDEKRGYYDEHERDWDAREDEYQNAALDGWQAATALQAEKIQDLSNELTRQIAETDDLRERKFLDLNGEKCWLYQGDGDDNLESLVCPVVIHAHDLLALTRQDERVRELEEWIEDKGEQFEQTMGGFSEALKLSRHCKYPSPQYVSVDAIEELFDGKVLVPVEPTESMLKAGVSIALSVSIHGQGGWKGYLSALYAAMLAASQEQGK